MTDAGHQTTGDDWLEIALETTAQFDSDTLETALFDAGALSVTLSSKADEAILIEPSPGALPLWQQGIIVKGLYDKGSDVKRLLAELAALLKTITLPLHQVHTFADRTWEREWLQYFRPMVFGKHLWVCPTGQQPPKQMISTKTQVINLDPGLAFGTGTHPTTAMALDYIAEQAMGTQNVIDYGCGSGILGIAAIKMGAVHCIMTDIDEQALTTAKSNAKKNGVLDNMQFSLPDEITRKTVDLVIANIMFKPLLSLKSTFAEYCHSQSTILLTGILKTQIDAIIKHYQDVFEQFSPSVCQDWAMITAQRSAH